MKKRNILIILSLILTTNIYSQETKYVIVEKLKNKVKTNLYEVKTKTINFGKKKRNIFLLDTVNIYNSIKGNFYAVNNTYGTEINSYYQLSKGYRIMKNDFNHFVKNELVSLDTIKKYIPYWRDQKELTNGINNYSPKYSDKDRYLIKSVDNGKLYFTNDNALDKIAVEESNYKLFKVIKDNNIKVVKENQKTYLSKNGVKCLFSETIKKELLNNNVNIIEETALAVKQYNAYYRQALKVLGIVTKHRQAYNSRTMTTLRLSKWKTDLNKLISIDKKMNDIHYGKYRNDKTSDLAYQYHRSFSKQLTREQVQISSTISDMIRECKILTGI